MIKRVFVLTLVSLLMQAGYVTTGQTQTDTQHADKIRSAIVRIGSCPKAKVEVTLIDKTKLKGCVTDWSDDQFTFVNKKTGRPTRVEYAQVATVKRSTRSAGKDLLWLGAALATLAIAIAILATAKD